MLGIKSHHTYYVGTELSRKFISFCLCDNTGLIIKNKKLPLNDTIILQEFDINYYIYHLQMFLQECHDYRIEAVGFGIPGHYREDVDYIISNNPMWSQLNLRLIQESISIPMYMENNAHCISLAIRYFDRYCNNDNYALFHVASGMFCSYVREGQLFASQNHLVGEVGHLVMKPEGELYDCGKKGCLQGYASEMAIIEKCKVLYRSSSFTFLRQLVSCESEITIKQVIDAYLLSDEAVMEIVHQALRYIVVAITNLQMIIDANHFYIHGELFDQAVIIDRLEQYINNNKTVIPTLLNPTIDIYHYYKTNGARGACAWAMKSSLIDYLPEE